jgi:hypothetical protein
MASGGRDFSWSERSLYRCACGLSFPANRWRWIDRDARPEVARRADEGGPLEGFCPTCGKAASGFVPWLDLSPSEETATIVVGEHARADVVELLQQHLAQLERRGDEVPAWMLQPELRFVASENSAVRSAPVAVEDAGVPKAVGAARFSAPAGEAESLAHVGGIELVDGTVRVTAQLAQEARRLWGTAAVRARPVLLRDFGYPLVGVRLVASHLGRMSLLDGLADVAQPETSDVFVALAKDFRLDLELRSGSSSSPVRREVAAVGLERNAALCLESARAELATGEYPPNAYKRALERLGTAALEERVRPAEHGLAAGDYRYLISPRETAAALEHLSAVSNKENLARLLELDGFSVDEYEAIRKRVLKASVEQGLCAPRRFWRRIVASGVVKDIEDYARQLSENRARLVEEGDDLSAERQAQAWSDIHDLCRRRGVAVPEATRAALGLPDPEEDETPQPRGNPTMSAAGAIGASTSPDGGESEVVRLRQRLGEPEQRLDAVADALRRRHALGEVLPALEHFGPEELLSVLPALNEVGSAAAPGLTKLLRSQNVELRQTCAILLGNAHDERALGPLCGMLFSESTDAWMDAARALGGFGKGALPHLCSGVRETTTLPEQEWMTRLARAMAEVVLDEGDSAPVQELEGSADEAIAYSATHALATLDAVRTETAAIHGDEPMNDPSPAREFSRRAHEVIRVPEIEPIEESAADVLGEADLEFI